MQQSPIYRSKGFTLIELVLVIVVLGILAATAAPKFIDLSSDAKKANMQALAGAMASAADLVFYKSKIPGYVEDGDKLHLDIGTVEIKGDGYPEARSEKGRLSFIDFITIDDDWIVCYSDDDPPNCKERSSSRVKIGYDPTGDPEPNKPKDRDRGCYVRYTEPTGTNYESSQKYVIEVFTEGC